MGRKAVRADLANLSAVAKWDLIAEDYYSSLHATTRNFDAIIDAHLPHFLEYIREGPILEVGGGRGRLLTLLRSSRPRIIIGDISVAMMKRCYEYAGIDRVQMSAVSCAFRDDAFTAVVSLLGDSFATRSAFKEFWRIVMWGGHLIMASPSIAWGRAFRHAMRWTIDETFIPTRRHGHIRVPSYLYSEEELEHALTKVGFTVDRITSYSASGVITDSNSLSPHILLAASILDVSPMELPLITMALASKSTAR